MSIAPTESGQLGLQINEVADAFPGVCIVLNRLLATILLLFICKLL